MGIPFRSAGDLWHGGRYHNEFLRPEVVIKGIELGTVGSESYTSKVGGDIPGTPKPGTVFMGPRCGELVAIESGCGIRFGLVRTRPTWNERQTPSRPRREEE